MEMQDQSETVAFLSRPDSYGPAVAEVERVETHASIVFLAGERAVKLKRAIKLPYLDYSTTALREAACRAEFEMNRRTAPELYLGVRRIARRPDGALAFGAGDAVDWVVEMRRFDQATLFDRLAERGALSQPLLRELADRIATFHDGAETSRSFGGADGIAGVIDINERAFAALRPGAFDSSAVRYLTAESRKLLERVAPLLDRRRDAGRVRRCHGDLHLRNICLVDGSPVLFDGIEFSAALATIDVAYDLAFLLMDLRHRSLRAAANLVLNRWLDMTGDDDCLPALPLFLSLRAAVRAHVTALAAESADDERLDEARAYLATATELLRPAAPRLVAVGGHSGTGKSTLGAALAPELGPAVGARLLRSDVIRKRLVGAAPEAKLPSDAYTREAGEQVYRTLYERAAASLAAGFSVVADAVSARPAERAAIEGVARAAGAPFDGIWLEAPRATLEARIDARRHDASDADAAVLGRQFGYDLGEITWTRVDASGGADECLERARRVLRLGRATADPP